MKNTFFACNNSAQLWYKDAKEQEFSTEEFEDFLQSFQKIKKGSVCFLIYKADAERDNGIKGLCSCTVVALTNHVTKPVGHVVFQNLLGKVYDIFDTDFVSEAATRQISLHVMNTNDTFTFLSLACLRTAPSLGLNALSEFALKCMCNLNHVTESAKFPVTRKEQVASVHITSFVCSKRAAYNNSAAWSSQETLYAGSYVIHKTALGEFKLSIVHLVEDKVVNLRGYATKVHDVIFITKLKQYS